MKASYAWLQSYFADPLPAPDELAALLTEHVFEVEGIERVGEDAVFDFKVLPDRAHYLLSHRGLAREIGVMIGRRIADAVPHEVPDGGAGATGVRIEAHDFCRRLVVRRFENVGGDAPEELRARLEAVGQKPINALVDISNYVMLDIGQPSHVLDADKVRGELVVRYARPGERIAVLGGREVELLPDDAVIADDEGPLEIAGVKGGERAAVTEATRRVIVHCGNYAPVPVRRTSTRLDLRSDASKRFENEITPALAEEGLRHLAASIASSCPDAKAGPVTDLYPVARKVDPVEVTAEQVSAMLGVPVAAEEIADLMARMDCVVEAEGGRIRITPPSDRFDLVMPADVADEVGRMRGYNALPGVLPPDLGAQQEQDPLFWYGEKLRGVLAARGYSEVQLYAFAPQGSFGITYPLAEDKAFLRENLADRLVERLAFNRRNADLLGLDAVKLCEIGQVFPPEGERSAFVLGVALTRLRKGEAAEDILREDLHAVSDALGIAVPDRTDSVEGGAVCEVDLAALLAQLPPPGRLADLALLPMSPTRYAPFSPYPFVARDIALFVPDGVARDQVQEVIDGAAGPLRVRSWVFDEFVKQTDAGARHSYAFRVVFQAPDRTLEDAEVNAAMERVAAAVSGHGWEVR